jgi:catalase
LAGTFTPARAAVSLTRAQHAVQTSTPVTVRFSDSTGVPLIPDNDPHADPRGMAITVQVAEDGDVVNDATVHWPAKRKVVELGTNALTSTVANRAHEQDYNIFDPIPRRDGIEPLDDPLLELRAAFYLISGRRRRTASEQ